MTPKILESRFHNCKISLILFWLYRNIAPMNKFKLPDSLGFLTSTRFWLMTLGVATAYVNGDLDLAQAIMTFASGFVGIRTVDRFGEKVGAEKKTEVKIDEPLHA